MGSGSCTLVILSIPEQFRIPLILTGFFNNYNLLATI